MLGEMIKDKKGVSKVTLFVLVLLIILVFVSYFVVKNVVLRDSGERSLGKLTLDLEIAQVQIVQNNSLNLVVRRNKGMGEFVGIDFIFNDGTIKETIFVNVSMGELETKSFILHLNIINVSEIKRISIDAIFKSESEKEHGKNIKDEYIVGSSGSDSSSNQILTVCVPNCSVEMECGSDGCGGECGVGCIGEYYNCSKNKCVPTLERKCLWSNFSIMRISNVTTNFSVTLFRNDGEGEIGGVKLVFTNASKGSNFVVNEVGNILPLENVTKYVTISENYITNLTKVRVIVYFIGERGIQEFCEPSEKALD